MMPAAPPPTTRRRLWTIPCGRHLLELGSRTLIMGVVNVTPDSFSDGSPNTDTVVAHALRLAADGADLLDIGGESTRPGAQPVPQDEELERVLPVIQALASRARIPLSIDTSKAVVARAALEAGAHLVNDVTALRGDPAMSSVIAQHHAPVILMHMAGTPQTMQRAPRYDDVAAEVCAFLSEAMTRAAAHGIDRERILLDPGIGFGKALEHNLALIAQLASLASLGRPLVIGPSRKSFLGQLTGRPVEERVWGTAAAVAIAAWQGVAIVRVHDVAAMRDVVRVVDALQGGVRASD